MHVGAATLEPRHGVAGEYTVDADNAEELRFRSRPTTPHAGAYGLRGDFCSGRFYRAHDPASDEAASDRMSIFQPVSRAASRAFWPSLPMASDNW